MKSEEFATATDSLRLDAVAARPLDACTAGNSSLFILHSSLSDTISQKSFVIKSEKQTVYSCDSKASVEVAPNTHMIEK